VLKLQNAARNSTEWFENVERYADLEPEEFAYSLLSPCGSSMAIRTPWDSSRGRRFPAKDTYGWGRLHRIGMSSRMSCATGLMPVGAQHGRHNSITPHLAGGPARSLETADRRAASVRERSGAFEWAPHACDP
jgi:hypothetical protein